MIEDAQTSDIDVDLPTAPIDLSIRMRDIRARQGLKQSEVARRMGLDPSIPSLWEQGKRPVPANRLQALAGALGVSIRELLSEPSESVPPVRAAALALRPSAGDSSADRVVRDRASLQTQALTQTGATAFAATAPQTIPPPSPVRVATVLAAEPAARGSAPFASAPRPLVQGPVPEGWEAGDRVQDIGPSLPDGYWLEPVKMEKPGPKQVMRQRLCLEDQKEIDGIDVPGAAIAQRIFSHCSKHDGFLNSRLPLVEAIFRAVLASEWAGLTPEGVASALEGRTGSVKMTQTLLRRLKDSIRPYPLIWVDRELFR